MTELDERKLGKAHISRWRLPLLVALLCASALVTHRAEAQVQAAATARINLLNKQAMEAYDSLEFEAAQKRLLEALTVAKQAGLKTGRALATTHIDLGIVFGAGQNDRTRAEEHFVFALKADATAVLDPARATPALEEMFNAARQTVASQPPPKPEEVRLQHETVDDQREGRRVVLRAQASDGQQVSSCMLYYRPRGRGPYIRVRMRSRGGGKYSASIPGRRVRPPFMHYYIEAQDDDGERLASSGNRGSPNIISISPRRKRSRRGKTISIAVMAGAGGGIVFGGTSEHAHRRVSSIQHEPVDIKPGAAPSPGHIAAEIGYHLTSRWRLTVMGRLQVLNLLDGSTVANKNPISALGLARAKRYFSLGTARPYLSFGAGGGMLRHRIELGDYDRQEDPDGSLTANDIVDARKAGYGVLSFGGGLDVMFNRHFGVVVDANGMILVPNFAAHLDLNLGFIVCL